MTAAHDRPALNAIKADRARLAAALLDAGGRFAGDKVACPFHDDTHPSGSVHQAGDGYLYTCHSCGWNRGKGTGDVFAVVMAAHGCDFKSALDHLGVNGPTGSNGNSLKPKSKPSAWDIDAAKKLAADSAARLMADPDALEHLWQTRAIDAKTAKTLGLGVTGEPGQRYVTMPITDAGGRFIGVKAHRLDGQSQKSWWEPKGVDRNQLFPVCLDGSGPVWVCPGELKAAALISLGLPAIGITSGEGNKDKATLIPERVVELLKSCGEAAALPPDDDTVGKLWGEKNYKVLDDAGINARIVNLGLDESAGLKDIGDFIVRELIDNAREPDGVRETMLHAYKQSDPWERFTFRGIITSAATWRPATYIPTGLNGFDELAGGGLRTRGVHLLVGKPGQAKTTLAMQIAGNAALAGVQTVIISLELTRQDLSKLIIAQHTGIPRRELDSGRVSEGRQSVLDTFKREHADAPLMIVDDDRWDGGLDRDKLAVLVAEGVKRFRWQLIVLDYLGLLAPGERDRGGFESDLLNSTTIKKLASKHDIAILVVAALRKSATFRKKDDSDTITLDDVCGAGRLTYDATSVWFVEAEQQWGHPPSGTLKVHCLKSRFSGAASLGEVMECRWVPHTGQVSEIVAQAGSEAIG